MATVYLGLGANLGNRRANLAMALRLVARMARIEAVSSLYETEPIGPDIIGGQPPFYNAACRIETGLEPKPLLRFLKSIEYEIGRRPGGPQSGPRPIDLDILLYEDRTVEEGDPSTLRLRSGQAGSGQGLVIPHPRLAERAFVLVPLGDIAQDLRHPGLGKSICELRDGIDRSGVKLIAPQGWEGELKPAYGGLRL